MSTTVSQPLLALEYANEVRVAHAAVKREVRELSALAGRELVADLLEHPSGPVLSMRVGDLLGAVRQVGDSKVTRWLVSADVRLAKRRVGDMSVRQRLVLGRRLRGLAG